MPAPDPTLITTPPIPDDLRNFPIELTDNARTVLRKRYLRRGEDGQPAETEQGMFWRVAYNIALAESEHGGTDETVDQVARRFFHLLTALQFFPNSPTFTGAGTPLGQLAACFTADMRVTTNIGQTRIADLAAGDLVLTHEGRYRPVREVYQRPYNDRLLRIKIYNIGTAIKVTPEHPILTPKGWVKAGELQIGDQVAVGQLAAAVQESFFAVASSDPLIANRLGYAPVADLDQRLFTTIDQIDAEYFDGLVYNCEVEDDHTYVVEGVVVHNCFVLAIDDDMGRSDTGIFQTLRNAALIQQTGGGNGFAFSRLRPKGAIVRSSNGQATGPVGFLRVYDQAFGEIAQGGCLTPDTLVFTDRGLLRLDEIVTETRPGWYTHSLTVPTDEGDRQSTQGYNNGVAPVYKVKTEAGIELTGTANHKIKVMTATGAEWRMIEELQPGDQAMFKLGGLQINHRGQEKDLSGGYAVLTFDKALVLGCMVANGSTSSAGCSVTVYPGAILTLRMEEMLKQASAGNTVDVRSSDDTQGTTFTVSGDFGELLAQNKVVFASPRDAYIPKFIRQSPPELVGHFLNGMFETIGHLENGFPAITHVSERVIREAAGLMMGLGIKVQIEQVLATDNQEAHWQLSVAHFPDALEQWRAWIGCWGTSRFAKCLPARYEFIHNPAPHLVSPYYMPLDQPIIQDTWFTPITAIEPMGESVTLDLEVDDNHTYLANGMIVHNSRRGANMAVLRVDHPDVRDFINCKTNESQITNFNISVGITDAFMRAVESDSTYDLINPQDGSVWETVRAREIYDLIVKNAHHNGEPGVLFLDAANRYNPVPHLYTLESTNPCVPGETLVATPDGWKRVDSIAEGDEICTVLGTGKVATIEVNEAVPVYKLKLSDGGTIRATAAHQFHVLNTESGEFEPRRVDQLTLGDAMRTWQPIAVDRPMVAAQYRIGGAVDQIDQIATAERPAIDATAQVVSIEPDGIERVYDLYEPKSDTWITNGYVSRGCGEQWLGPFENCCLGSINVAKIATEDGKVDWEKFRDLIETSTRFLDDVVTANKYVPAVPQLKEAAHRVRRIGLGIMGLADLMYALGVRYGSEEGQEFAGQITEFLRYHAMKTSVALAQERGPFPAITGSIYDPQDMKWQPPKPLFPYTRNWARPSLDWNEIVAGIKQNGIRNGAQTTVAPTGCLIPGTLVTTDQGILPIETLGDVNGAQWQDISLNVATEGGVLPATQFYINGNAHTLKATTARGYKIQGTDQHRIRVWVDGSWEWRRMDELAPGMRVPLQSSGLIGDPRPVPLDTTIETDFHPSAITLPTQMTADLAYLVGFFMGDGSLKARSLRYAVSDFASETRLISLMQSVFGLKAKVSLDSRSAVLHSVEFHSVNLIAFWRRNGFAKRLPHADHTGKGYEPHVPLAILQTNDADVYGAFLAGLFDADGTASHGLSWLTTNELFHDQVKSLLLTLGILTTSDLQTSGMGQSRSYRLRTANVKAMRRLQQALPYLCRVDLSKFSARRTTLGDIVPITASQYYDLVEMAGHGAARANLQSWKTVGYATREAFNRFGEQHRPAIIEAGMNTLIAAADDDIYYDTIESLVDGGWQNTYDISVPGTHAYVANGFISHNTIATVSGCEGYGCEPVFALAYIRHVNDQGKDLQLQYTSPLLEKALDKANLSKPQIDAIIGEVNATGTCQNIVDIPEHIRHTFVVSSDISIDEHVRMQAAMQAFIDNSLSKTINAPITATESDVAAAYMLGWKLGCKGMTVYVTGSRDKVVLETHATAQTKQIDSAAPATANEPVAAVPTPEPIAMAAAPAPIAHLTETVLAPAPKPVKKSRPHKLIGRTYRVETPLGKTYVTINENGEGLGYPFEIFTHTSKAGSDTAAVSEAIGRLISLMLRLRAPLTSPRDRLKEIAHELDGIGGGRPTGFGAARVRSLPDGIARVLQEYLDETEDNLGAPTELPPKAVTMAASAAQPAPATLPAGENQPTEAGHGTATAKPTADRNARIIGDLCPECGEATLVNEEGCRKCYTCGYSEC